MCKSVRKKVCPSVIVSGCNNVRYLLVWLSVIKEVREYGVLCSDMSIYGIDPCGKMPIDASVYKNSMRS